MDTSTAVKYVGHDGIERKAFIAETAETVGLPVPDEQEAEVLGRFGYPAKHAAANGGMDLSDGEVILAIVDKGQHRWAGYLRRATLTDDGTYRRVEGNYRIKNGGTYREPEGDDGYGY